MMVRKRHIGDTGETLNQQMEVLRALVTGLDTEWKMFKVSIAVYPSNSLSSSRSLIEAPRTTRTNQMCNTFELQVILGSACCLFTFLHFCNELPGFPASPNFTPVTALIRGTNGRVIATSTDSFASRNAKWQSCSGRAGELSRLALDFFVRWGSRSTNEMDLYTRTSICPTSKRHYFTRDHHPSFPISNVRLWIQGFLYRRA